MKKSKGTNWVAVGAISAAIVAAIALWQVLKPTQNRPAAPYGQTSIPDTLKSSLTIDKESLHFTKSTKTRFIFSGTVQPSDLCQKVRVSVKREGGHACFNREPICNNDKWKVDCTEELEYLRPGKYEVIVKAEGISELVFFEISE